MYHCIPPMNFDHFGLATDPIKKLVEVAMKYGCEQVIKLSNENLLNSFRTEIYQECAESRVAMLKFAVELKRGWVFQEAATNLLGRNYELSLLRIRDVQTYLSQERINFFRDWLCQALDQNLGAGLAPGYAKVYHSISSIKYFNAQQRKEAARTYSNRVDLANTHGERFVAYAVSVFNQAAAIMKPILKDNTRRQSTKSDAFRALTFMTIRNDELPWVEKGMWAGLGRKHEIQDATGC
ncbi:hypothetical protein LTR86_005446 [Recurvomyces mirabilis]|nr:hypothetical protein LTR86_005446 [Recurvomyces mirabilis]